MTDRPLRPLFPKGYFYDTQVISVLLSADGENDPDILSITGASAALCLSDIPFAGPIGAVRIARINGEFVVNPTHTQRQQSELDLVYVGSAEEVVMIEGAADDISEEDFIRPLEFAQPYVREIVDMQKELTEVAGKPKREVQLLSVRDDLLEIAYQVPGDRIEAALYTPGKVARAKALDALRQEVKSTIIAKYPDATRFEISQAFDYLQKKAFRVSILDRKTRCDGRGLHDLRTLAAQDCFFPRSHWSTPFPTREAHAPALSTLASGAESPMIDT